MYVPRKITISVLASLWLQYTTASPLDLSQDDSRIITRDVCIIGGGSSGTYAAIRLREMGHSVVVVEKEPLLGGHTNTYFDPVSGKYIDYGVLVYQDIPESRNYFARFNIPTTLQIFSRLIENERVDLRNGERVPPPQGNQTEAMMRYAEQLAKYPYLSDGWDLPDPVPEDLLLPFGEFVEKYDLAPAMEFLTLYVQGLLDWLQFPTVYIMKYFSLAVVRSVESGFLVTEDRNNGALYTAAANELAGDVLYSSTVQAMDRSESRPHRVLVRTPSGLRLIRANRTIITVPPKLDILQNFNLDDLERNIFGQFENSYYYSTVTRLSGVPPGKQVLNRGVDTLYNLPPLPAILTFTPTIVPELYSVVWGGGSKTEEGVRQSIRDAVLAIRKAGFNVSDPDILAYSDHAPFEMFVSAEKIANGFYRDLYGLQGHRKTYYAGAAFHAHDSAALWRSVDGLLEGF